jgi:thioesterase domain-containing protein/acyl carrier protein
LDDQSVAIRSFAQDDRRTVADVPFVADKIRRIFHQIFDTEVGENEDFFDLGGDSLAGETLLSGIERELGISLPLSILLETSTPRSLADAIAAKGKAVSPKILFAASDSGSRTPLLCIHARNGTAAFSRKIQKVLPDRPIYALRALGLLPGEIPLISIPEMADTYIREIRKVRPSGPYHIFGQCGMAQIAYEVAQQLSSAGEQVKTVTLGDPFRIKPRSRIHRLYYWLIGRRAIRVARRFPEMSGKERRKKVMAPAMVAAEKTYEARPYSGKVLIVAASDNVDHLVGAKRSYAALVQHLETVVVDGGHHEVFKDMDPAAPGTLARAMSSFLARHD